MRDAVAFGVDVGAALGLLDDVSDEVGFAGEVTVGVVFGVAVAGTRLALGVTVGTDISTPDILFFAINSSL